MSATRSHEANQIYANYPTNIQCSNIISREVTAESELISFSWECNVSQSDLNAFAAFEAWPQEDSLRKTSTDEKANINFLLFCEPAMLSTTQALGDSKSLPKCNLNDAPIYKKKSLSERNKHRALLHLIF